MSKNEDVQRLIKAFDDGKFLSIFNTSTGKITEDIDKTVFTEDPIIMDKWFPAYDLNDRYLGFFAPWGFDITGE